MNFLADKSPEEKKKIIAASVLGVLAFIAVGYNIILPMLWSKKTKVRVDVSASPTATISPNSSPANNVPVVTQIPSQQETDFIYTTTPLIIPGVISASRSGKKYFCLLRTAEANSV